MADNAHRFSRHETGRAVKSRSLRGGQVSRKHRRSDLRAPQNLVRHPIPDTVKTALIQEHRFDRGASVPIEELGDKLRRKLGRRDFRRRVPPPLRFAGAMMKAHAPKQPRVTKHERAMALSQHDVVVFLRPEICRRDAKFARHAEMDSQPLAPRETEQDLFAASVRFRQPRTRQKTNQPAHISLAKDPLPRVGIDGENLFPDTALPFLSVKFDFRELRHVGD